MSSVSTVYTLAKSSESEMREALRIQLLRVTNRAACGHVTFTLLSEHFERMKDHTRETIPVSYLLVLLPH